MLCLVRIKSCERCGGDVALECDIYGVYAECIQCGATWHQKVPKLNFVSEPEKGLPPRGTGISAPNGLAATPTPQRTKKILGKQR
jgi:hypothetical protein